MADKRLKCEVRDGLFVDPCDTLASMVENIAPGFSKAKGIACWTYTNMRTHQHSRRFHGILTKEHPDGMLFNFCPWCGADISAPFTSKEEDESPSERVGAGREGL